MKDPKRVLFEKSRYFLFRSDRDGRNERAVKNYEERCYRKAIEEWNAQKRAKAAIAALESKN